MPLVRHPLMGADVVVADGVRWYCPRDARPLTILELFLLRSGEHRALRAAARRR